MEELHHQFSHVMPLPQQGGQRGCLLPSSPGDGGAGEEEEEEEASAAGQTERARCKAKIVGHPLFEQLLSAHVACLRIATPVDQLPRIDAQLSQSHHVVAKYTAASSAGANPDDGELHQFMVISLSLSLSLVVYVASAGVSPGEGTGATMSDDEEDEADGDITLFDASLDGTEDMGFGLPTERERSLMERVRQELKHELKQGYKEKLMDIREEILRKRRAGKLPGDTTTLLKAWWQSHSKWPYPTVRNAKSIHLLPRSSLHDDAVD
ncbi:hypothetical protein GW17_00006077 [Ensete ventricosum]|nr:hypothetical protein GW17_00006077 [Ensete ventricosum]